MGWKSNGWRWKDDSTKRNQWSNTISGSGGTWISGSSGKYSLEASQSFTHEAADVIYHLLVTLESAGVSFNDIITELKKREGTSGFEEKRNR